MHCLPRALVFALLLLGCATPTPRPNPVVPDADPEDLSAEAQAALDRQLQQTAIDANAFELVARIEPTGGDGLKLSVVCFARSDHALRAQVQVTGHGPRKKLIASMIAKAARDLSADCR